MSASSFPIPYPNKNPSDDLATARLMLRAVAFYMERGEELASEEVQSLFNVPYSSLEIMQIIQLFLDDCDFPGMMDQYRAARRSWILQNGGAA